MVTSDADALENFKTKVIAGEVSLFDLLRNNASGDYRAHIDTFRLMNVLGRDIEVLKALLRETDKEIASNTTVRANEDAIAKGIESKDGHRRLRKLFDHQREMNLELTPPFSQATSNPDLINICL